MKQTHEHVRRFSAWDIAYAANMAIGCLISYWIMTGTLSRFVDRPSGLLGAMWPAVATVFVFREDRARSLSAGMPHMVVAAISPENAWRQPLPRWRLVQVGRLVAVFWLGRRTGALNPAGTNAAGLSEDRC